MSERNITGGSAFPYQEIDEGSYLDEGMTLLDYFAGQALAGMEANDVGWDLGHEDTARLAYSAAAAMIAEKHKRESEYK